jgi:hypothetical protein
MADLSYTRYRQFSPGLRARFRARYGRDFGRNLRRQYLAGRSPGAPADPAAPAPASSPAAAGSPGLPVDPSFQDQLGQIGRRLGNTLAGLEAQEAGVRQEYGFDDTSNPYNRAALLERAFRQRQAFATNSLASAGQLYSGALQTSQNEAAFGYGQNLDALRRSYEAALSAIRQRRLEAQDAATEAGLSAQSDAVSRALAERPDPGEVPPPEEEGAPPPPRGASLPRGYRSWSLARRQRYWARRRRIRDGSR